MVSLVRWKEKGNCRSTAPSFPAARSTSKPARTARSSSVADPPVVKATSCVKRCQSFAVKTKLRFPETRSTHCLAVSGFKRLVKGSVDFDGVEEFGEIGGFVKAVWPARGIHVAAPVRIRPSGRADPQDMRCRGGHTLMGGTATLGNIQGIGLAGMILSARHVEHAGGQRSFWFARRHGRYLHSIDGAPVTRAE